MDFSSIAFAWGAGLLAAFNPCGFVLLPTYAAAFLADDNPQGGLRSVLGVSGKLTLGFLTVFTAIGAVVGVLGRTASEVGDLASWLGTATGALLLLAGIVLISGRKLPGLNLRVGSTRGAFSYGVGYAAASLACALPVYLTSVVYAFDRGGIGDGIASGVAYSLGMTTVVSGVVVLTATARKGAIGRMRNSARWFGPLAGALMILAGLVLLVRRWADVPLLDSWSSAVVDRVDRTRWLPVAILAVALSAMVVRARRRRAQDAEEEARQ
jgi:cytochrome c biogenesis protein CcdA